MNKTTTLELLSMIREAADRIRDSIYLSPCPYSAELSASTGQQVYLKLENLQMTGAYKERGALNKILLLSPEEEQRGVICRLGRQPRAGRRLSRHAPRHPQHHRDAHGHAAGQGDGHAELRRRSDPPRRQLRRSLRARAGLAASSAR